MSTTKVRNTPLQSRVARQGYTPLPGHTVSDHPQGQEAPNKVHTVSSGGAPPGEAAPTTPNTETLPAVVSRRKKLFG